MLNLIAVVPVKVTYSMWHGLCGSVLLNHAVVVENCLTGFVVASPVVPAVTVAYRVALMRNVSFILQLEVFAVLGCYAALVASSEN